MEDINDYNEDDANESTDLEEKGVVIQSEVPHDDLDNVDELTPVTLTKKEKKRKKLNNRYFYENDIRYRGPLSYRSLRIIAWIAMAASQIVSLNEFSTRLIKTGILGDGLELFFMIFSTLSVPLFIIATFSTILNKGKTIKSVIIFYAAAAIGLALALIFLYYRYVVALFTSLGADTIDIAAVNVSLGYKLKVNVFVDLLMLSIFYFFIMYDPKKHFQGKWHYVFRALSILPMLYAIASYYIKVFASLSAGTENEFIIPVALNVFLTTKPLPIYILFIALTLWLKRREKQIKKLGGSKAAIERFENSNRNSLSFSGFTSILCLVISMIELGGLIATFLVGDLSILFTLNAFEIGNSAGLFLAIPFLMLFSYSRKHKDSSIDIIIILGGVGLMGLTTVEMIYRIITTFVAAAKVPETAATLLTMLL